MKRVVLVLGLMLLGTCPARAWQFPSLPYSTLDWLAARYPGLVPGIEGLGLGDLAATGDEDPDLESLRRKIGMVMSRDGIPGAAVALIQNHRITWLEGFGTADPASGRKVDPETPFRVGSISQVVVTLAALRLAEAGRLDLDAPVKDLLPDVTFENPWAGTDPVRIRHLLSHTSGIDDWHINEYGHDEPDPLPLEEGLSFNPSTRRIRWRPGTHYAASYAGPPVVARVLETITGERFETLARDLVFQPLDMPHATFLKDGRVKESLASGHEVGREGPVSYWNMVQRPGGSLNVSARELANLVSMLVNGGMFGSKRFLGPESVRILHRPADTLAGESGLKFGFGAGIGATLVNAHLFHGLTGMIPGYIAEIAYRPDGGVGYVVLANQRSEGVGEIGGVLGRFITKGMERKTPRRVDLPEEVLKSYEGTYRFDTPRNEISRFLTRWFALEVQYSDGSLFLEIPGVDQDIEMIPVSEKLFTFQRAPCAFFAMTRDGDQAYLQSGFVSFREVPTRRATVERKLMDWVLFFIQGALVAGIFWIPGFLMGLAAEEDEHNARTYPYFATFCFFFWFLLISLSTDCFCERFGQMTIWSVSLWALSWLYAVFTILGLVDLVRAVRSSGATGTLLHCGIVGVSNLIVVMYFWSFGLIGLRSWGY